MSERERENKKELEQWGGTKGEGEADTEQGA